MKLYLNDGEVQEDEQGNQYFDVNFMSLGWKTFLAQLVIRLIISVIFFGFGFILGAY